MEAKISEKHTPVVKESTNRIPVLHIIKSLGRGGAETLLPETLAWHNQERFVFHYIYFLPWKYEMVSAIEGAGGIVHCFNATNNFAILRKVQQVVAYVRRHKIQLIHCHLPWAGILGRWVGKRTGVPVVYTEHNTWTRYHKITFFINKWSFGAQKKVVAVSAEVAHSIRLHYRKANPVVQVVENGIDIQKFSRDSADNFDVRRQLGIPEAAVVIGTACVFRLQKRLHLWLEVAGKLKDHPGIHFIIAGDGVLHNEVHQKAASLGLGSRLHFVGMQPHIRPYLRAMNIFMMTSEFEGLPIALLEAMSMECMPACTAAGGIGEIVKDEANGVLVPVVQPMLLAERLLPYLKQPALISARGTAARQTVVSRYGLQQMVGQLETIYEELSIGTA